MEYSEFSGKTVEEALTTACQELGASSDKVEYEVVEEGASGFLGIGAKQAVIKARIIDADITAKAKEFLNDVFSSMNMVVVINASYDDIEKELSIDLAGDEMGVLIGKRGQTLDSLQYLVSLVVNKDEEDYIRVKIDTENYRERRIIHSALQDDKYVTTHSEGEEPYRYVVVSPKKGEYYNEGNRSGGYGRKYSKRY